MTDKVERGTILTNFRDDKSPNIGSDIETVKVEDASTSVNQNPSIWGTFHFIAKSDRDMQTKAYGPRALSPVVDPNMIPQEVLEDIYGGKKLILKISKSDYEIFKNSSFVKSDKD